MDDQLNDELIRDLYATFGLAYYQSECLHRGLCIAHAYLGLPQADFLTGPRVEELLAHSFSLTLGEVAEKLAGILPAHWNIEIRKAVEIRNFLAHHFWFDRAHLMHNTNNIRLLIAELQGYSDKFDKLDIQISEWSKLKEKQKQLGISDEALQDNLMKILAGEDEEPLPDKKTVRELEKKLRNKQRLIRVWEPALEGGSRSLIFELADGTLWQLSDIGLGQTRFEKVGRDWKENQTIRTHLPTDITPHPKCDSPWDYEFTLASNVVLWVKPGQKKKTFKWGLRLPPERVGNESTSG
ncbi:MAG: hypothetical protein E8D50_07540 [Nitrospira sp.]|nr:MAG: hypothetical protein E8D50_07540 [Nitrospira sp.]